MYKRAVLKNGTVLYSKLMRTPEGMRYRVQTGRNEAAYSYTEMWNYITRDGGIWE